MAEKSIKKNAIYSSIRAIMTFVFPLITFPYASRILMPEGIGRVNFANSIVSYFTMLAGLGIGAYATRGAARVRQDKTQLSKFAKEVFCINLVSTLISYSLFFIALFFIPKFSEYRSLLLVCSTTVIFTTLGMDWLYTALEEFRYITIRSIFFQCVSLIFLFLFVHTKEDYIRYAFFGIISSVGSNICNFIYARKFINFNIKVKLEIKPHLKPIFTFFGMSLITSVYTMLDSTMLGFLSGDIEVGYYSAATKLNKMVLGILIAVTSVLLPRLSLYAEKKDATSFDLLVEKAFCVITLLGLPCTVGLILLAKPLVLLFSGNEYLPAVLPMQVISPIILIISIASLTGTQILPAVNKEKIALISYCLGAAINVTINYLLIPQYGALGAAIGTVGAETAVTTFQLIILGKSILRRSIFVNSLQSFIATAGMGIVVYFIITYIQNILLQIGLGVIFGICVYSIVLFLLRNKYFLLYTSQFVGKLVPRK